MAEQIVPTAGTSTESMKQHLAALWLVSACAAHGAPNPAAPRAEDAGATVITPWKAPAEPEPECRTDVDCEKGFHCMCPGAGPADPSGKGRCGGPYRCYAPGTFPPPMPSPGP
jgi:hypothetical protein